MDESQNKAPHAPGDDPRVAEIRKLYSNNPQVLSICDIADALAARTAELERDLERHVESEWDALKRYRVRNAVLERENAKIEGEITELERENAELHGEVAAYRETRTAEVIADLQAQLAALRQLTDRHEETTDGKS